MKDEIIEEGWVASDRIAKKYNYVRVMAKALQQKESLSKVKMVDLHESCKAHTHTI